MHGDNMIPYDTLEQYLHRVKTEGKVVIVYLVSIYNNGLIFMTKL